MRLITLLIALLIPAFALADKHEDINSGIREILIALSQVSVQGKDATTFSQVQGALSKISKDIADLAGQQKILEDQVKQCEVEEAKRVQEQKP